MFYIQIAIFVKIIEESPWQYDVSLEQLKRLKMQFCICVFVCFICVFVYLCICTLVFAYLYFVFVYLYLGEDCPWQRASISMQQQLRSFFSRRLKNHAAILFTRGLHCFCRQSKANININVNFQTPSKNTGYLFIAQNQFRKECSRIMF